MCLWVWLAFLDGGFCVFRFVFTSILFFSKNWARLVHIYLIMGITFRGDVQKRGGIVVGERKVWMVNLIHIPSLTTRSAMNDKIEISNIQISILETEKHIHKRTP